MNLMRQLELLKHDVQEDLKTGASIQFVVDQYFNRIEPILRKRGKKSGPYTLRQLADLLGFSYPGFKTAYKRRVKKSTEIQVSSKKESVLVSKPVVSVIPPVDYLNDESDVEELPEIDKNHIKQGDVEWICSCKQFLLNDGKQSVPSLMCFVEQSDGIWRFDAFARRGQSKLSKVVKFQVEKGFF